MEGYTRDQIAALVRETLQGLADTGTPVVIHHMTVNVTLPAPSARKPRQRSSDIPVAAGHPNVARLPSAS